MNFIFNGVEPTNQAEKDRVTSASRYLQAVGDELHISGTEGWRIVPPIAERWVILYRYHNLNHCHAEQLYTTVKKTFYWRHLRTDCINIVSACRAC